MSIHSIIIDPVNINKWIKADDILEQHIISIESIDSDSIRVWWREIEADYERKI